MITNQPLIMASNQPTVIQQPSILARQPYRLNTGLQPTFVIRDPRYNPVMQISNPRNVFTVVNAVPIEKKPKEKEPLKVNTYSFDVAEKEHDVAKYYEPYYKYYDTVYI